MGYVFMIVAGAILGWLVAFVLRTECKRDLALNMGAGVLGALLTGLLIGPAVSQGNLAAGTYTVEAILISMGGALAAVFAANILHQREVL